MKKFMAFRLAHARQGVNGYSILEPVDHRFYDKKKEAKNVVKELTGIGHPEIYTILKVYIPEAHKLVENGT